MFSKKLTALACLLSTFASHAACPAGARYSESGGNAFCLFEGINLPGGGGSYCQHLNSHRMIGYFYNKNSSNFSHFCASGLQREEANDVVWCLKRNLHLPFGTQPYCNYFASQGVVGYYWPK